MISEKTYSSSVNKDNLARSVARLSAVQTLYQIEFNSVSVEKSISYFSSIAPNELSEDISEKLHDVDEEFYRLLVTGTQDLVDKINDILDESLDESWPIDRMETLLLTILRCGIYEIIAHKEIPPAVLVSEYISISDSFFSGNESALVNAILDKLSKRYFYNPLQMSSTFFNPNDKEIIVPTENDNYFRKRQLKGEVHDENAYILNGVSGHAGLFSNAYDIGNSSINLNIVFCYSSSK